MSEYFEDDEGLIECAYCGGQFLPEDMEGEHCNQCADDLFQDDDE